jgi:hypothetical protein
MMRTIRQIIDDIGMGALAKKLGHRWPTTVQGWRDRESIPGGQIANVVKASVDLGKPTTADELAAAMAAAAPPKPKRKKAA